MAQNSEKLNIDWLNDPDIFSHSLPDGDVKYHGLSQFGDIKVIHLPGFFNFQGIRFLRLGEFEENFNISDINEFKLSFIIKNINPESQEKIQAYLENVLAATGNISKKGYNQYFNFSRYFGKKDFDLNLDMFDYVVLDRDLLLIVSWDLFRIAGFYIPGPKMIDNPFKKGDVLRYSCNFIGKVLSITQNSIFIQVEKSLCPKFDEELQNGLLPYIYKLEGNEFSKAISESSLKLLDKEKSDATG